MEEMEEKSKDNKEAWRHINEQMMSMGYKRDTCRLKQQWNRMKTQSKMKLAAVRKATIATGNHVPIISLDESDEEILNLIAPELKEDTCLIDSDSKFVTTEPKNILSPLTENDINQNENKPEQSPYIQKLKCLPKPKTKLSVLEERENQIKIEIALAEELQKKQIEKLENEIKHQTIMNDMQITHLKELHEKQLKHADELHEMKK